LLNLFSQLIVGERTKLAGRADLAPLDPHTGSERPFS
jgi:hypothetical protein